MDLLVESSDISTFNNQFLNLYVYLGNNPINDIDPYGLLSSKGGPFGIGYSAQDYADGKNNLIKALRQKYSCMSDADIEKAATDIMNAMSVLEGNAINTATKAGDKQAIQNIIQNIYKRTGDNLIPQNGSNK
jgi:hypothetical protein